MPKAVIIPEIGGPEVLQIKNLKTPQPKKNELKIKHTVIGINYTDIYHRSGLYPLPKLPTVPGIQGIGIVTEVGPETEGFKEGDRIGYATGPVGSYREERVIPSNIAISLPDNIDDETAGALLAKGLMAHTLSRRVYLIVPGQFALIHAVTGGVSSIVCQMTKAAKGRVIGTVHSDSHIEYAKEIGCDYIINYKKENFLSKVHEITNNQGLPVVYDSIGKDTFNDSIRCLHNYGTMVSFGFSSGYVKNVELSMLEKKSLFLTCPKLIDYKNNQMELIISAGEIFDLFEEGAIKVIINKRYTIDQIQEAHREMEEETPKGANIIVF